MRLIYSRTQFWFDLKAGGSVGHTAGVIEGLSEFADVEVIGNDRLCGVENTPCTVVRPVVRKELLYNLQFAPALTAKVKSFRPDFIYHRYSGPSVATAFVCRRTKTPLVLEFNGSDVWVFRYWNTGTGLRRNPVVRAVSRRILEFNERFNLQSAFLIVVVSESLKKGLVESGIPAGRILVNPNATNPDKFKDAPPDVRHALKRRLGIPEDRTVIGFSGTFGQWHGIPELAEAIEKLNEDPVRRGRLFFVLYGDGELRQDFERRVAHYDNVLLAGTIDYERIQDYLSLCDMFVSPHGKTPDGREFFGSPTKIFEYMAMGKGIVASNLGQIGDVLEDGRTAILVEPGDVEELVRGITHLADNPDEAARLGKNACDVVMEKHTWKKHAGRIVRAFEDIQQHGEIQQWA